MTIRYGGPVSVEAEFVIRVSSTAEKRPRCNNILMHIQARSYKVSAVGYSDSFVKFKAKVALMLA